MTYVEQGEELWMEDVNDKLIMILSSDSLTSMYKHHVILVVIICLYGYYVCMYVYVGTYMRMHTNMISIILYMLQPDL